VNRKYETKEKELVVNYISIKKQMNLALFHYNEEMEQSIIMAKDHLNLLNKMLHKFDASP